MKIIFFVKKLYLKIKLKIIQLQQIISKNVFKIYLEKFPSIKYEELSTDIHKIYHEIHQILFSKRKYFNLRNEIYRDAYDKINNYNLIDNFAIIKEKIEFLKENDEKVVIKIFRTN